MEEIRMNLPIEIFLKGLGNLELQNKLIIQAIDTQLLNILRFLSEDNSFCFHIYKIPYTEWEIQEAIEYTRYSVGLIRDLKPYNLGVVFTEKPIVKVEPIIPRPMPIQEQPQKVSWWKKLKNKIFGAKLKDRRK